jgi:hypothetical protein
LAALLASLLYAGPLFLTMLLIVLRDPASNGAGGGYSWFGTLAPLNLYEAWIVIGQVCRFHFTQACCWASLKLCAHAAFCRQGSQG